MIRRWLLNLKSNRHTRFGMEQNKAPRKRNGHESVRVFVMASPTPKATTRVGLCERCAYRRQHTDLYFGNQAGRDMQGAVIKRISRRETWY